MHDKKMVYIVKKTKKSTWLKSTNKIRSYTSKINEAIRFRTALDASKSADNYDSIWCVWL